MLNYHFRKVLETVAEMSNWNGPLGNGRGRDVAFVESFGTPTAEVVEVTMTDTEASGSIRSRITVDVGKVIDPVKSGKPGAGRCRVWDLAMP